MKLIDNCKGVFSRVNEGKQHSTKYCLSKAPFVCFYFLIYSDWGPYTVFPPFPSSEASWGCSHSPPSPIDLERIINHLYINESTFHGTQPGPYYTELPVWKETQLQKTCPQSKNLSMRFSLKFIFKGALYFVSLGTLNH